MTREEREKALYALREPTPIMAMTPNEFDDYSKTLNKIADWLEQEPCEDCISRKSIKHKLQEHIDFFANAYGGFSNLPQNDKSRVDEIINCIAMVVNEPPVTPKPKTDVLDKIRAEIEEVQTYKMFEGEDTVYVERNDVFKIIGKYKAEKE